MFVFFFKQKTAYEMRISDWSSDVCSSDLKPRWPRCDDGCSAVPEYLHPRSLCLLTADHPWCAVAIDEHAEAGRPEGLAERHQNLATVGERVENFLCLGHRRIVERSEEHTSELQSLMRHS